MTGIDHGKSQLIGIPEIVVADVAGDEGVAACVDGILPHTGASATANCYLADRLAAIHITQSVAAQFFLHQCQKICHSAFKLAGTEQVLTLDGMDVFQFQGLVSALRLPLPCRHRASSRFQDTATDSSQAFRGCCRRQVPPSLP